jgi:uncharacterized protein (TIGR03067 family)
MHRTVCLLAALLVLPALGSDSPKEYDDKAETDGLEGSWRLVTWEFNGGGAIPTVGTITFHGRRFVEDNGTRGTFTTDTQRKPAHFDQTYATGDFAGQTYIGIYQRDGDTLRIAIHSGGELRPKDFNSNGRFIVQTWERQK